MQSLNVKPLQKPFNIVIDNIASDKSISHRCAMFSLLSNETSYIKNFLTAEDTLNTLSIVEQLGATVTRDGSSVTIVPPFGYCILIDTEVSWRGKTKILQIWHSTKLEDI